MVRNGWGAMGEKRVEVKSYPTLLSHTEEHALGPAGNKDPLKDFEQVISAFAPQFRNVIVVIV